MIEMCTAFVSSTGDLDEERRLIHDKLIDISVFPYAMEHFAVATLGGFDDIKVLIDNSDFFILVLGKRYGTREYRGGKSWTQKEFEYCQEKAAVNGTNIYVIQLPELTEMVSQYSDSLSDEEVSKLDPGQDPDDIRDQIRFARSFDESSTMKNSIPDTAQIGDNVVKFVLRMRESGKVKGWIRGIPKQGYKGVEFGKKYYQVHLSETDHNYLRMGTVEFSMIDGSDIISAKGQNFQAVYRPKKDKFLFIRENTTNWSGQYTVDRTNKGPDLMGVYTAKKYGNGVYKDQIMQAGVREGIHSFEINQEVDDFNPYRLFGWFQDAASLMNPDLGCKTGALYVFDTQDDCIDYLRAVRPNLFEE